MPTATRLQLLPICMAPACAFPAVHGQQCRRKLLAVRSFSLTQTCAQAGTPARNRLNSQLLIDVHTITLLFWHSLPLLASATGCCSGVSHLLLLQAVDFHSKELRKVVDEVDRHKAAAHEHASRARAAVQRAQRALAGQEQLAGRYQDTVLHLQELGLAVQFEQMANKERGQRHKAIDEVCWHVPVSVGLWLTVLLACLVSRGW